MRLGIQIVECNPNTKYTTNKEDDTRIVFLPTEALMDHETEKIVLEARKGWRPRPLAASLDVAPSVIYEAIAKGEMEVWRFGKAIVIPEWEVQKWLDSKMQRSAA